MVINVLRKRQSNVKTLHLLHKHIDLFIANNLIHNPALNSYLKQLLMFSELSHTPLEC